MKVCPQCGGAYPVEEGFCPMDGARLRTLHGDGGDARTADACADAWAHAWLGTVLDRRYRLDAVIGEGGMGLVFRATHVLIGKPLAVKLLRREHLDAPDVARRFLLEARVASSLKHPNVVDISDFGELPDGGAYYVMELLEGRTLAKRIDRGGPLPPAEAGGRRAPDLRGALGRARAGRRAPRSQAGQRVPVRSAARRRAPDREAARLRHRPRRPASDHGQRRGARHARVHVARDGAGAATSITAPISMRSA